MAVKKIYGKENQRQGNLIKGVNMIASPLPLIENGMCYMLSLNWIIRCLSKPPRTTHDFLHEFDIMTTDISELRLVAQNFSSYMANILKFNLGNLKIHSAAWIKELTAEVKEFVTVLSRGEKSAKLYVPNATLNPRSPILDTLAIRPYREAFLVLIYFMQDEKSVHIYIMSVS